MFKNKLSRVIFPIFGIFLVAFLISCKEKQGKQAPVQEIPVVEVISKDVPLFKEFVGQVYGEKDIPIRARVEGFLESMHFVEGGKVKKGQLLYTIDPEPFQARVNSQKSKLAEAKTMMVRAESELNRYKPLAELNAVSKSDLDAAQAEYDASVSSVAAAKANLNSAKIELGYSKIYSPISGTIGITLAKVGEFVGRDPNPVILNMVSKTNMVQVRFFVTENDYLLLARESEERRKEARGKNESDEEGQLRLILSDGSYYPYNGKVDFIDRGISENTGSLLVQATFPNEEGLLRPGFYAKVKVEMFIEEDAILIPQRCVMELQGQYSVYVVTAENKVESRQVKVGDRIGDLWLIKEGLSNNEKIVIDALQKVGHGLIVNPKIIEFKSKTIEQ